MSKNKTLLSYFNKTSSIKNNLTPESPQHEKLNSEKLKSPKFSTPGKRSASESKINSPDDTEENKINCNGSAVSSARSKRRRIVIASDSESSSDEYKPGKDSSDSESSEGSNVSEAELELTAVKKSVKSNAKIENKSFTLSSKKSPVIISKNTKSKLAAFSPAEKVKSEITVEAESKEWSHLKLDWLKDGQRKDKKGRPMSHPDYDPRTLYVSENFRKCLTPAMKQWWEMKAEHFDTVLFFKVGKFYELYHMDAVTAVNELGLVYMKGEFAHSGFPEIAYCRYSEGLIQKGYKVARVEQTETPQMMEERCKGIPKPTRFDKVVTREICQITTKGTRTFSFQDGEVISANASYLLAITERIPGSSSFGESEYGVCFIDTSIGKFYIGQFIDDRHCSRVRTMIVHYPPVEVLYEKDTISKKTHQTLNCTLGSCRKEALFKGTQFWETSKVLKFLIDGKYFSDKDKKGDFDACEWPETIEEMLDNDDRLQQTAKKNCELAIRALGACIWYLKECCIEDQMLTMKNFEHYIPLDGNELKYSKVKKSFSGQHMILDGVTLQNLEILESNTSEMFGGSLQEAMDFCCTNFGKRLFRQWLCSPLCNPQSIADRLDAVEDLQKISHVTIEPIKRLKKMPDLEKLLSRIHTQGLARSEDHPDTRAIFYQEDTYTKKKIIDFLSALEGFRSAIKIVSHFKSYVKDFRSSILSKCVRLESDGGHFPDLQDAIEFFDNAFDHEKAKKEGQIKPAKGVDNEYDTAVKDLTEAQKELDFYLEKQRKRFQCKVTYHGTGRNRFQLEIPEHATKHATNKYELQSQKKGFKRYWTAEIKELLACVVAAEEQRDSALHDIMRRIFETFDKKYVLWKAAVHCLSILDVLLCFLQYSQSCQVTMCRPEIIEAEDESEVILEIHGGRHPSLLRSFTGDSYIPNDVCLGSFQHSGKEMKKGDNIVLVTGPNMGGKSTLMRQTGLLIIMAQMGSYIPAEKCCLTPVDRIFTRLGASDRIIAGESTFFVEISETASILQHATQDSLVLVDELGRGTATYDGTAIACAVIRELANKINCRTLFSTHYHCLVEEFSSNSKVALGHMACIVEDDDKHPALESITFLYKFMEGVCPKSYGFNVAHLAGIPDEVIQNSYHKAKEFESSVESQKVFGLLNLCKSMKDLQYIQSLYS